MHAPFHVRPAQPGDLNALAELGPRTFQEAFGALLPADFVEARMALAYGPERLSQDLADPAQAWFLAEAGPDLVGFLALKEGEAPEAVASPRPLEVARLYVAQAWQGRGPGAELLVAGVREARARGARHLWLLAWEENPRALSFYRRQGFEAVGTRAVAFGDRELPHLVLVRPVEGP